MGGARVIGLGMASETPLPAGDSKDGRAFEKLVMWASSLSIAAMAAFLASLKQVNPVIEVRFTIGTVIAFVLGAVLTVFFLRTLMHGNKRWRALLVVAAAIVSVLTYFLLSIKKTSQANRSDVIIGTICAVAVLSFVAWLLWSLSRYLERDDAENRREGK